MNRSDLVCCTNQLEIGQVLGNLSVCFDKKTHFSKNTNNHKKGDPKLTLSSWSHSLCEYASKFSYHVYNSAVRRPIYILDNMT